MPKTSIASCAHEMNALGKLCRLGRILELEIGDPRPVEARPRDPYIVMNVAIQESAYPSSAKLHSFPAQPTIGVRERASLGIWATCQPLFHGLILRTMAFYPFSLAECTRCRCMPAHPGNDAGNMGDWPKS
jgi:hypothetical protein